MCEILVKVKRKTQIYNKQGLLESKGSTNGLRIRIFKAFLLRLFLMNLHRFGLKWGNAGYEYFH